jgi:hypothetical protein
MNNLTTEEFAHRMYDFYSNEAGRVSLVGTPLPDWQRFATSPENASHYRAWLNTMAYAAEILLGPKIEQVMAPLPGISP